MPHRRAGDLPPGKLSRAKSRSDDIHIFAFVGRRCFRAGKGLSSSSSLSSSLLKVVVVMVAVIFSCCRSPAKKSTWRACLVKSAGEKEAKHATLCVEYWVLSLLSTCRVYYSRLQGVFVRQEVLELAVRAAQLGAYAPQRGSQGSATPPGSKSAPPKKTGTGEQ